MSDLDSDDEKLLDVRTASVKICSNQGKYSCANNPLDVRIDPKELLEYLQPLIGGLAENLSVRERENLAAAIYGYKDMLISGPEDGANRSGYALH